MMPSVTDVAHTAHAAGICVVPPKQDGSKAPDATSWTEFQRRLPTDTELARWYGDHARTGIGYICGRISGGLELLDFDDAASAWAEFQRLVDDNGLTALWARITAGYLERTPAGGYHVLFRSPRPSGATKLAQRPKQPHEKQHERDAWQVLIETKGEGGYVVAAPTNGSVHPSGGRYELLSGGVTSIATITAAERDSLLALSRMLDQKPRPQFTADPPPRNDRVQGDKPGDQFNARTTWDELLTPYGWRVDHRRGATTYWTRPGKDEGVSASTNHQGSDLLYVFTSSTDLDPDRSYDRFGFFTVMEHGGDFRAAARSVGGVGSGAEPTTQAGTGDRQHTPSGSFGSAEHEHHGHANPWVAMMPLPVATPAAPTMPEALVPEPLRRWLVDAANRSKLPLEMLAAPAIVAAGGLVGRTVGIRPGRYDEFTAVPNLWGAIVARPGWMKTEAYKEPYRPIGRLITKAKADHEAASRLMEGKAARLKAELKSIERRMAMAARGDPPKEGQAVESLETLEAEYAAKSAEAATAVATERRYHTQDPTVEKLGALLRENPRGMTLLRDELSGWLLTLGKPGREGDREFYLEAWNGTGSFTVDRIARGTLYIPSLTLSVFGCIQPGKLRHLLDGAIEGGMGDDGMMQRLQVLIAPDALPAWAQPTGWGDLEAKARVDTIYATLDTLTPEAVGAQTADIPYLRYSEAAQEVADAWRDALERRLRSGALDETPAFASHLSKYRSLMPSLALVFSLIDLAAATPGVTTGRVDEHHVRLAADWCGFLEAHARKVYAAETQGAVAAAHALAEKIDAGAVFDGQPVRELYRAQWSGLRTPELVLAALTELTDLGWVRVEFALTGGRPSQVVRLHPDLAQRSQTHAERAERTDKSGEASDE